MFILLILLALKYKKSEESNEPGNYVIEIRRTHNKGLTDAEIEKVLSELKENQDNIDAENSEISLII